MQKRLLQSMDLDDLHLHTTKKIIASSDKPHLILLHVLQRKNLHVQQLNDAYIQQYSKRRSKTLNQQGKNFTAPKANLANKNKLIRHKIISRRKLEVVSNLIKIDKKKIVDNDDLQVSDAFNRRKTQRKQLPISKFNLSDPLDTQQEQGKTSYGLYFSNEKQNRVHIRSPVHKFNPFETKAENNVLNSIRYSALLRPLNLERSFQNYSTKLPQIPLPRKLEQLYGNKSIFKRVKFA